MVILSQGQRDAVMGQFRDKTLQLLIATDVAARGIDVKEITHVINFEFLMMLRFIRTEVVVQVVQEARVFECLLFIQEKLLSFARLKKWYSSHFIN